MGGTSAKISFILSEELRDKAKDYAESIGLTLSSYLRNLLVKDLQKKGH